MSDDLFFLKTLDEPYYDQGLTVGNHKNNPCPFHGGSDHMSIWESSDGTILWKCHNPGSMDRDDAKGTIIDLWMHINAMDLKDAIEDLKARYMPGYSSDDPLPTKIERPPKPDKIYPTPTDRDPPELDAVDYDGEPIKGVWYKDGDAWSVRYFSEASYISQVTVEYEGKLHSMVSARWDDEDGKFMRPVHWAEDAGVWRTGLGLKSHMQRPVYKHKEIAESSGKTVIIVEGEKCMTRLQSAIDELKDMSFFDGDDHDYSQYIVTSCVQGGVNYTDWSPLEDHSVIIMPDMDEPGIKKVKSIFMAAPHRNISVLWPRANPDVDKLPENGGYDVADFIEEEGSSVSALLRRDGVHPDHLFDEEGTSAEDMPARSFNPDAHVRNFTQHHYLDENGNEKTAKHFVPLPRVVNTIHNLYDDWPRVVNDELVIPGRDWGKVGGTKAVNRIDKAGELSSWLYRTSSVYWTDGQVVQGAGEKVRSLNFGDVLHALKDQTKHDYRGVQTIPHQPPVKNMLYSSDITPGDGRALREIVDVFNADSELDRKLLECALLTPLWGGGPGRRPAFVISTDHGRGVGKSATVEMIAKAYHGSLQIQEGEEWDDVMGRIFSDEALQKRILFIDNLKGLMDSGAMEGAITRHEISGHKLYQGEKTVPNYFTWFISANTPELSTDLAERAVVIKIGPKPDFDFDSWFEDFFANKHLQLLRDIKARLLEEDRCSLNQTSRFRSWEEAMLTRFENGNELFKLIENRRGKVDAEAQDALKTKEMIEDLLTAKGFDPRSDKVIIGTDTLTSALANLWGVDNITPKGFWSHWKKIKIQPFLHGRGEKGRYGQYRGLVWNPNNDMECERYSDREIQNPSMMF